MSDAYTLVKFLHIGSAILLLGAGLGNAFHFYAAWRAGTNATLAVVARHTVWADWLFIAPAAVAQPVTGLALMALGGIDPAAGWLLASWALYAVAIGCWLRALRLQYRVADLAARAPCPHAAPAGACRRHLREWFWLGWPALAALVAAVALMVAKPDLL